MIGVHVCKDVFMHTHCACPLKLLSIKDHSNVGISAPPDHGSTGTVPWNAASIDDIQEVRAVHETL